MATVNTGIIHFLVVTVNSKHPNAAHNHPHELECNKEVVSYPAPPTHLGSACMKGAGHETNKEAVTTAATAGDKGGHGAPFIVIF